MAAATVAETALQDRQDTATSPLAPLGDDDFDDEDGIQGRDAGLGFSAFLYGILIKFRILLSDT